MVDAAAEPRVLLQLQHRTQRALLWLWQHHLPHPAWQNLHRTALPLRVCIAMSFLVMLNKSACSLFNKLLCCFGHEEAVPRMCAALGRYSSCKVSDVQINICLENRN